MIRLLVLSSLLLAAFLPTSIAQVGFTGSYRFNKAPDWVLKNGTLQETELLGDGPSFGVDYWFRLKKYRIEFLPEFNVGLLKADLPGGAQTKVGQASLFFNTRFYVFDFKGDCDCPTFSKQGPKLEKGFFIELSPGLSWLHKKVITDAGDEVDGLKHKGFVPNIAIGAGLDIGVSDLITLSPIIGYRYFPQAEWAGLSEVTALFDEPLALSAESSSIGQLYATLRLGLRFDYHTPGRRRR